MLASLAASASNCVRAHRLQGGLHSRRSIHEKCEIRLNENTLHARFSFFVLKDQFFCATFIGYKFINYLEIFNLPVRLISAMLL